MQDVVNITKSDYIAEVKEYCRQYYPAALFMKGEQVLGGPSGNVSKSLANINVKLIDSFLPGF